MPEREGPSGVVRADRPSKGDCALVLIISIVTTRNAAAIRASVRIVFRFAISIVPQFPDFLFDLRSNASQRNSIMVVVIFGVDRPLLLKARTRPAKLVNALRVA